ncbi:MAG: phosphate acetyltransferase [Spirochaetota bacterium]
MEKKIFIASTEQQSGKSMITIGFIKALQGIVPNVGYMKPIGQRFQSMGKIDEDAALVKGIFKLPDDLSSINPVTMEDAQKDKDALFEKIFDAYKVISSGRDVVVIEGTDYTSAIAALEFDINAELAKNLVAPVLLVANGAEKSVDEIVQNLTECTESFKSMGCSILGAIINRFEIEQFEKNNGKGAIDRLRNQLESGGIKLFGTIPGNQFLAGPRLKEVAEKLGAEIFVKGDDLSKVVTDVKVLAMTPENALEYVKDRDGYLLITPGDRVEHIFTMLCAQKSVHFPHYSGIILTGGLTPGENVRKLITGLSDPDLSILTVKGDTYSTALKVSEIRGELKQDDFEKIELVNHLVERHIDFNRIYAHLGTIRTDITTPRMFQYRIIQRAKAIPKLIVLPEGTEPRIIQAASEVLEKGICRITLLGNKEKIMELSRNLGADLSRAAIIDPINTDKTTIEDYAETLYQMRKHKSVTREMALDLLLDPVHFATMMVHKGHADGFVSGTTHSTADTLGPVLRVIKSKPGVSLASSIFFMCMPERVLVYGDCALVENPNAEQLADIAITSADTAKAFGIEPYVAMLSYSTGGSGKGADVDKVREAAGIAKKRRPDLPIEGPLQYDAATSEEVAKVKLKDSAVAGKATVYIFPDLDAGNTAYKAVQRSANIPAIGPVLQGLNKPANDLSRGATVLDIVYTIAITAIQAQ